MSIGQFVRKILGPECFKYAGSAYRRIFVDLDKVARTLPEIPAGSHLLDIGGGDGALINSVMKRFPGIKITMIDLAGTLGSMIDEKYKDSVRIFPSTGILQFKKSLAAGLSPVDFILVSDVIHHVAPPGRKLFFSDLSQLIGENTVMIIKDIEPGFFLSKLSYWADKYISGDRTVTLTSGSEVINLMRENFPGIHCSETGLFRINKPNFSLVFSQPIQPRRFNRVGSTA